MGDRIVVLREGVVQQVDTPLNLYQKPANMFVAGFIGSPSMNFIPGRLARQDSVFVFDAGSWRVPIPQTLTPYVEPWGGKEVILGIRPEHIEDAALRNGALPPHFAALRAKVEVHEPLGSDVILYLEAGGHSLVARVDANSSARMGDEVTVALDMSRLHLFDPINHQAIV